MKGDSKMKIISTALMALGLLLLTGCATLAPSPTATPAPTETPEPRMATGSEDIVGIWFNLVVPLYSQFNPDGTSQQAFTLDNLQDQPDVIAEFSFEGTQLLIRELEYSSVFQCENPVGIYEVQLLENGNLRFTIMEDDCPLRRDGLRGVHEPVR